MTKILLCDRLCRSRYQDERYGSRQRLHTLRTRGDIKVWRCSACGAERIAKLPLETTERGEAR